MKFISEYNIHLENLSGGYSLTNLSSLNIHYTNDSYWDRIANLSVFEKNMAENGYHFLYEIRSLSSQIHFGVVNSLLFRDLKSDKKGYPNVHNHRYTFFLESTIHGIYGYWNRVAMFLNYYLHKRIPKKMVILRKVLLQLTNDYPELTGHESYKYLEGIQSDLEQFGRNEMAHNNSLILQDFLNGNDPSGINLDAIPEKLVYHNNTIVHDIEILIELFEYLENNNT